MFGECIDLGKVRQRKERVEAALKALTERTNEDAFVIISERQTRKFVQFARLDKGELMMDVPFQAVAPNELDRAVHFFKKMSEKKGQNPLENAGPGNKPQAFQMLFGNNVEEATAMTLSFFDLVYQLGSDCELVFEEN